MAEAVLGRGDRAWEYYRKVAPPVLSEAAGPDVYLNEPYMYSSHIVADPDPRRGMANLSWLTGSVNWMYIVATQHLLGIRPTLAGLRVDPCLPPDGKGFRVTRRFRGATYRIEVVNRGAGRPARLWLDGRPLAGDVLPALPIGARAEVRAEV
jgi:cellobiose phosphorylase